jgi:hypothetical protein
MVLLMAAMEVVVVVVDMDMDTAAVKEEKGRRRRGMRTPGTRCGAVDAYVAG